jgi:tetratricopeptide (TPR) repeat protein
MPSLNSTGKSIGLVNEKGFAKVFPLRQLGVLTIKASCLAMIVVGIVWNIFFATADLLGRRNQPESTRWAMRLAPANGAYPAQLADEIFAIDSASARSLLQGAVELNRYDASSWIQLGLLCEAGNDFPRAEEAFLRAAGVDSTFLPSWSLANFYFRHENVDRFWYWAEKAAQMAPDDPTSLFRLAWYVHPSVAEIEYRLRMKEPGIERQFVNFVVSQGDPAAVTEAALHMLKDSDKHSVETLLGACEWLIEEKRPELAWPLWNGLAARHLIAYPPFAAGSPDLVTNGKFGKSPISKGFDWHLSTVEGVSSFLNASPDALGFEFSGHEPNSALLMTQAAPVQARKPYALIIDYTTSGISPGSGLEWLVTDDRSGAVLARTESLAAEQGGKASACFTGPDSAAFVNLSLVYQRQPGTVRAEGRLALHEVRLSTAAAEDCAKKISSSGADSSGF